MTVTWDERLASSFEEKKSAGKPGADCFESGAAARA